MGIEFSSNKLKVRLQTIPYISLDSQNMMRNNTMDCVRLTLKYEGFLGLYKGFLPILFGTIFFKCLSLIDFIYLLNSIQKASYQATRPTFSATRLASNCRTHCLTPHFKTTINIGTFFLRAHSAAPLATWSRYRPNDWSVCFRCKHRWTWYISNSSKLQIIIVRALWNTMECWPALATCKRVAAFKLIIRDHWLRK